MRQLAEEERQKQHQSKKQLGSYYKQQVDDIDNKRKQDFSLRKSDTSNFEQTL